MALKIKQSANPPTSTASTIKIFDNKYINSTGSVSNLMSDEATSNQIASDYTITQADCGINRINYIVGEIVKLTLPSTIENGSVLKVATENGKLTLYSAEQIYLNGNYDQYVAMEDNNHAILLKIQGGWMVLSSTDCFFPIRYNKLVAGSGIWSISGLDSSGIAWTAGHNETYANLGDNTTISKLTPVKVCGNTTFCQLSQYIHSVALDKDGMLWGWGYNAYGQVGDNTTTQKSTPVRVCGTTTFCQIYVSSSWSSHGIDKDNMTWGWGDNQYGQIGRNSTTSSRTPVRTCGSTTFCKIAIGGSHVLAIDKDGMLWAWGLNSTAGSNCPGCVGDNTIVNKCTPIRVCGTTTFCQIAASTTHSVGIDKDGMAWGWGGNTYGVLGNNTTVSRCTPTRTCGNTTFCKIAAVNSFTLAIDKDGMLWGWGFGNYGLFANDRQLTNICRCTPVRLWTNITFCEIVVSVSAGAIDKDGIVWSWGYNGNGQCADGTRVNRPSMGRVRYQPLNI